MAAGLRAYQHLLADPSARRFSLAGLLARLPISMTGIGTVLLVSLTTGSFGRAGVITAAGTVTAAVALPIWGRAIDRLGQARVLVTAVAINGVSLTMLIISVQLGWSLIISVVASVGTGIGATSAGASVRARWSHRFSGTPALSTAFALEAMLDEVVFIVGPILVAFLATTLHPAAGLATAGILGLIGALALAAQTGSQPPIPPHTASRAAREPLPLKILLPVACAALGMIFGGMEVVVVAFAKATGVLSYAGVILMMWALGSLVAGAVVGMVAWRSPPARQFRLGALALGLSLVPLVFVSQPIPVAALLVISGMAIAPTLIASVSVTQAAVPAQRLTESLAWINTGLASGVAAGAVISGSTIDAYGWRAGFIGVACAGGLLIVLALLVRTPPAPSGWPRQPGTDQPDTGASAALSEGVPGTRPAGPIPFEAETPLR